ncbi:MAG: hypothetical protein NTV42_02215 [Chloroflexi bacterium]|nr:hypothetical protein [Chloroflexota bacterium]MCX6002071.1 hypothetical protein [Chloroflexota bacterium]
MDILILATAGNDKLPPATSQSMQANPSLFLNSLVKLDFKAAIYYNGADSSQMKMAAEFCTGGVR